MILDFRFWLSSPLNPLPAIGAREAELPHNQTVDPRQIDRVFDYRKPLNLVVGLVLVPAAGWFVFSLVAASFRGEVTVNGVAGDGRIQWVPAIFAVVAGAPFLILGVLMLLSYFSERIVWRKGVISWYDRFGRLRVRADINDIYDVMREDTPFAMNAEDDRGVKIRLGEGPFNEHRKRPLEKITIYTANGDIPFYENIPWAEELESLARQVVLNKIPTREIGESWVGN